MSNIVEIGKLTEMEAGDQIVEHFMTNELFHQAHHGSLPSLDTTTALIAVQKFINDAAERKELCATVFIDQSSAFDLVDHKILLSKLKVYNFGQTPLKLFESYLQDRTYQYKIESKLSQARMTGPYGVPQGSALGSLLYVIYQNDQPATDKQDQQSQSTCYVDDETEQSSHKDPVTLQRNIQDRIDNMVSWLNDNRMVVSPSKTKLILSCTKELRSKRYDGINFSIEVNNHTIHPTNSEKLLGVIISQDITWAAYLWGENWRDSGNWPGLIPTLTRRLGLLKHLARLCSKKKMKEFIPGIFTSRLRYALPLIGSVWGIDSHMCREPHKYSFTKNDLLALQSLQRQIALLVSENPDNFHQSTENALK